MTKRERILGGAVAISLATFGASYLWKNYQNNLAQKRTSVNAAEQELAEANMTINSGTHAIGRIASWQEKSLPTNRDVAYSLYRTWLLEIAKDAGLMIEDIRVDPRTSLSPAYRTIGYTIEARGQLPTIAAFLHAFYSRDLLQQITRFNLQSNDGSSDLIVSMQLEAMLLPGATHTTDLPSGAANRLALANADEYKKSLADRSMFKVYTPPRPPSPPPVVRERPAPPAFDNAKHAYVTAILQTGTRLQAWIWVRPTDEVLRLFEGDKLKVGDLEAEVKSISINPRAIVLKTSDDQELHIELGKSLRGGEEPPVAESAEG